MSASATDAVDRIKIIVGDVNDILLRDVALVTVATYERMEELMGAIEDLTAAADRVTTETGETKTLVEQLRAAQNVLTAAVDTLTEQVAQGRIDTAAVQAVADQLQAAADSLDADNAPPEPDPVPDPVPDPEPDPNG